MAKQTATKEKTQEKVQEAPDTQRQQVAVLQPPRLPYNKVYQERYGIDGMMWRALVEAVFPSAKTVEGIILAISYCKAKNYDVMKKMVNVVPIWNSQLRKEVEGVWEAVAALRATAFRTGEYAGCDETVFGPMKKFHFDDKVGYGDKAERVVMDLEMPEWARVTVYRMVQGQRCQFVGPKVTYLGAYGCKGKSEIPNDKWGISEDSYMLEKCAEAAALRKAFPEALGGVNAWEEMEGRKLNIPAGETIEHEDTPPRPTRDSTKADIERARQEQAEQDSHIRDTVREEPRAGNQTVEHNSETGEIADETDGPSGSQQTGNDTPSTAKGEVQDNPKAPVKAPTEVDWKAKCEDLMEKVQGSSKPRALDAILKDYEVEIGEMRTEEPDYYAILMAEVDSRRKWFAR